jgi:hypothetical protein
MRKKIPLVVLAILSLSCITVGYTSCKKQATSQPAQNGTSRQATLDLMKQSFALTNRSNKKVSSGSDLAEPSNPNNLLDWIGIEHNKNLKSIVNSVPENPEIEDYYNSYRTLCGNAGFTPKTFVQFDADIENNISRVYVEDPENKRFIINPDMFTSEECTESSNAIVRYFIQDMYDTEDYLLRRQKSLQAEDIVLEAGDLSDEEKASCLSIITLFKWSDYYWSNENPNTNELYSYPGPSFWDVVWIKGSVNHADGMSPYTQNPSGFMLDCIGYTALMSAIFNKHFGV